MKITINENCLRRFKIDTIYIYQDFLVLRHFVKRINSRIIRINFVTIALNSQSLIKTF